MTDSFQHAGLTTLHVIENDSGAKLRKVLIRGAPSSSYVIALDGVSLTSRRCAHPIKQFSMHLNVAKKQINKICDAVVVDVVEEGFRVSLVDLKSESPKLSDARQQLHNSELFINYVSSLLAWVSGSPKPFVASRRIIMRGSTKSPVGGGKISVNQHDGMGVIALPTDANGVAKIGFAQLFD